MAVPRPILLAVLGLLLIVAAFIATRPKGDEASTQTPKPASSEPAVGSRSQDSDASKPPGAATPRDRAGSNSAAERTAPPDTARVTGTRSGPSPAALQRALDRGRLLVLFVRQRRGADDAATARSVAALRRARPPRTTIAGVPVADIADYTTITGPLGVSQAPTVVLVTKRGRDKSHVLEGYVDAASLKQRVADALK